VSCQVTKEGCLHSKELNPEDMESKVEHWEVPIEEPAVKSTGTIKKWHRSQNLAAGQCRGPKELTREECGSQRKLAATCK
jgi:hypothetical protein